MAAGTLAAVGRCRGLLATARDQESDEHFEAALSIQLEGPSQFETARTQLCYGEALRRAKRVAAARRQLREALITFRRLAAEPWVERTRSELAAAGDRESSERPVFRDLTAQEIQVAFLTAEGLTTREVASRLFLSPKTVETHLSHAYQKLKIRSRTELARLVTLEQAS